MFTEEDDNDAAEHAHEVGLLAQAEQEAIAGLLMSSVGMTPATGAVCLTHTGFAVLTYGNWKGRKPCEFEGYTVDWVQAGQVQPLGEDDDEDLPFA